MLARNMIEMQGRITTQHPLGTGPWTPDEHERFLRATKLYPHGPWKAIAAFVVTRSVRQTQTHAQKYREKLARRRRGLKRRHKKTFGIEPYYKSTNAGQSFIQSDQELHSVCSIPNKLTLSPNTRPMHKKLAPSNAITSKSTEQGSACIPIQSQTTFASPQKSNILNTISTIEPLIIGMGQQESMQFTMTTIKQSCEYSPLTFRGSNKASHDRHLNTIATNYAIDNKRDTKTMDQSIEETRIDEVDAGSEFICIENLCFESCLDYLIAFFMPC